MFLARLGAAVRAASVNTFRLSAATPVRCYAKGGGSSSSSPSGGAGLESAMQTRMESALDALRKELAAIRAGRPSASVLDQVMVDAKGSKAPLTRFAAVSVRDPGTLNVNVFDKEVRLPSAPLPRLPLLACLFACGDCKVVLCVCTGVDVCLGTDDAHGGEGHSRVRPEPQPGGGRCHPQGATAQVRVPGGRGRGRVSGGVVWT